MPKVKLLCTGNNEGFIRYTINGHEYKVEKGKTVEVEKEDVSQLMKYAPFTLVEEVAEPIIKQPAGEVKKEEPKKEEPFVIPSVENKKPVSKEEKEALLSDVEKNLDDILTKIDKTERKQKRGKTK